MRSHRYIMSPSKRQFFVLTFSTEPKQKSGEGDSKRERRGGKKESTHRGLITLHNYF